MTAMYFYPEEDWGFIIFYNANPETGGGFWETISLVSEYAHLYGNIYAINTEVNKPYLSLITDTVTVISRFSNINQHNFTGNAIYVNSDSSYIDSVALYDDGLHGDSLAGDGLWGGFIHSVSQEDFFDIGISTLDTESGEYFHTRNLVRFTTAGPVSVDSTSWSYNSLFNYYSVGPYIHNNGNDFTINNPLVSLTSNDPWITSISGPITYPSLPPGAVTTGPKFIVRVDSTLFPGYFNFKISIGADGWYYWQDEFDIVITGVDDIVSIPTEYSLEQNYPNPFNPVTTINYGIRERSMVELKIYDILGREVVVLINKEQNAGSYEVELNATKLSSGIYFYRLQAGDPSTSSGQSFIETKKMILLR
jgi:hypothetical protein